MSKIPVVNKIHHNNSTTISLNDRFTIIRTYASSKASNTSPKSRNRSASRGSPKSLQLLNKLEKQHKILAAQKLKRRSLRQRENRLRNAAKILNITPQTKLRRAYSLSNIAT